MRFHRWPGANHYFYPRGGAGASGLWAAHTGLGTAHPVMAHPGAAFAPARRGNVVRAAWRRFRRGPCRRPSRRSAASVPAVPPPAHGGHRDPPVRAIHRTWARAGGRDMLAARRRRTFASRSDSRREAAAVRSKSGRTKDSLPQRQPSPRPGRPSGLTIIKVNGDYSLLLNSIFPK
jgi:hypothetical protein